MAKWLNWAHAYIFIWLQVIWNVSLYKILYLHKTLYAFYTFSSTTDSPIKFNFVILVAGFKSRQSSHSDLYSKQITIPSLHVFGETDKVIQKGKSRSLILIHRAWKVHSWYRHCIVVEDCCINCVNSCLYFVCKLGCFIIV